MTRNNCYLWAHVKHRELWDSWATGGMPVDRVPCILRRPSRLATPKLGHYLVGWWCPGTGAIEEVQSFVPDDKQPLPWWKLWKSLFFLGRVKHGDVPSKY